MGQATTADSGVQSPRTGSSERPSQPTGRQGASGSSKGKARKPRTARPLFSFDRNLGARFVAGVDEAGRGSLAGPLVAAGVLFDYDRLSRGELRALAGLDDSKLKSAEQREELYPLVLSAAVRVAVTARCVRGIDGHGLHRTNLDALADCLRRVACDGAACVVDGFPIPGCELDHTPVVDGDRRSAAIAAASVLAKVTRDRYMHRIDETYPGWGFAAHVGYSTPEHRAAIATIGISCHHRRSFDSVAYRQLRLDPAPEPSAKAA